MVQEPEAALETTTNFNWWLILAIIQFITIAFLFYRNRKLKLALVNPDKFDELKVAKTSDINMTDLMDNINNSRDDYKILSRKCHPDRFQNEEDKIKADDLFQEVSLHKRNHAKLAELKIRAERELNIKF
jgi:hypothetical protein